MESTNTKLIPVAGPDVKMEDKSFKPTVLHAGPSMQLEEVKT